MPLNFEGETLTIGGRDYTGTIYIETEVSDASFDHAFGTEHVLDIIHHPACFYAYGVSNCLAAELDCDARPALADWLTKNLSRVEKRFDMDVKRGILSHD